MRPSDIAIGSAFIPVSVGQAHNGAVRRTSGTIRVCHVMSADLWAGAEVQVATVASHLIQQPDVMLTAALFNDGPLADELCRLGVPVTVISEKHLSAPRIVEALTRVLRTHAVDIVHTHRYKDTLLGAIAAGMAGVPFLLRTVHGRPEPMQGWASLRFRAYNAIDRAVLRWFADAIVAVSTSVAKGLEPLAGRYAPVVRLQNGINLDRVKSVRCRQEVRRALDIAPDAPVIGVVGRLSPVKGHRYFLDAAQRILARDPRSRFLVVGDGELRTDLTAHASGLGLEGRCRFLGARSDVYDLVSALDVFVLPSLDEGTPMALLEAMALEVPIVASDVGGIPDVVRDGETGMLVPPANVEALSEACLTLLRNRALALSLASRARRVVETEFSHQTNGDRLAELYRSVMARETTGTIRSRLHERFASRGKATGGRSRVFVQRALGSAYRRFDDVVARQRARQHRRDPTRPLARLRAASRVLILCHGNIIRSPFAARLIAKALGPGSPVTIVSAGLEAIPGRPSPIAPVLAADRFHVNLRGHTASLLTSQAVGSADVIFVMEARQLAAVRRRFPAAGAKTFLLTCLAVDTPLDVRDPIDGGEAVCVACFEHISHAVRPVVAALARC